MHKKNLALAILAAAGSLASSASLAQEVMARVLTSTAVMQQVAVPRQVCTTQSVVQPSQPSGAGAAMGAIAGGAVGNAIGDGSGRALATMIGLVGGAIMGNKIEGTRDEVRQVQQCTTQTSYENRVLHYDVVYEYDNKRYSIKMPNDPGAYVRLQLQPMGALPAGAPSTTTTIITSPVSSAPLPTVTYVQSAAVQVLPVHAHPSAAFTVYPAYPTYPSVRYVAPISLSIHGSFGHPGPARHGARGGHPHRYWH